MQQETRAMTVIEQYSSSSERSWCIAVHLAALSMFIVPFGFLLGPLVVWLIKRAEMPALDRHGKEVLNFQITYLLASIVAGLLTFVLIGFVLLFVLAAANVILVIMAAIKASEGKAFAYPFTWRVIK